MVSKNQPSVNNKWPPPGWKEQIKVNNGRKMKYYIHTKTRQKMYSKPALLRYIMDGSVSDDRSHSREEHAQKSSEKKQMQLVQAYESPQWLPSGWTVELRTRKSGSKQGTTYKCYIDQTTGHTFFSKPEVDRYLESKQGSSGSCGQKKSRSSRHSSNNMSVVPLSAQKSNFEPNVSQISKTRVRKSTSSGEMKVVVDKSVDDDLPSGWIKETRKKMNGNQEVRRTTFYFDPASRLVFCSKLEVLRYVENGEISRHAYRRRDRSIKEEDLEIIKSSPRSSNKKDTTGCTTSEQFFAGEKTPEEIVSLVTKARAAIEAGIRSTRSSSRLRLASGEQGAMLPEPASISPDILPARRLVKKGSAAEATVNMNRTIPCKVKDADSEEKDSTVMETKPHLVSSRDILTVENPQAAAIHGCSSGKTQKSKRKTKDRELPSVPSRSSKRLAGVDAQVVFHSIPIEHALRATSRKSSGNKSIPNLGSAPEDLKEKPSLLDVNTQNVLASQVAEHRNTDVDTQTVLANLELPSKNSDRLIQKDPEQTGLQQASPGFRVPSRSSKRLAGVDAQVVFHSVPIEHALRARAKSRKSSGKRPIPCSGSASDDLQEKPRSLDVDTPSVLASQEAEYRNTDVDTQTALATRALPSNNSDILTQKEAEQTDLQLAPPGFSVPSRSSKRLAGVDAQVVFHSVPIEHALRATSRKSSGKRRDPSLGLAPNDLQENLRSLDVDTQSVLASQEAVHCNTDVDTQTMLATRALPSNNSDSLTQKEPERTDLEQAPPGFSVSSRSTKRLAGVDAQVTFHSVPVEHTLRTTNRKSSGCNPNPSLESAPNEILENPRSLDVDTQHVLVSQEAEHCNPDVGTETVLPTQGLPSNKCDSLTRKDLKWIDLLEAPPGFSVPSCSFDRLARVDAQVASRSVPIEHAIRATARKSSGNRPIPCLASAPDALHEKPRLLDVDTQNILASQDAEHHNPDVDRPTQKDPELSNPLEDPPVISEDLMIEVSPVNIVRSSEEQIDAVPVSATENFSRDHFIPVPERQLDTFPGSKIEKSAASFPILEEQMASIGRDTEQSVSVFNFSSSLWSDPCLEFAYKTLTGAIPLDDNLAIEDYIQHQLRTSKQSNDDHSHRDSGVSSFFENDETKLVPPMPEEVSFPKSNGFSSHKRGR